MHSCQVYKRRDWDKVENMNNAREILRTTPTFGRPHPLSGDYVLPHPLNIEIYGLKLLSLCLCHTSIYAIKLDSGAMLQNQVNWDTNGTQGQIPGLSRPNRDTWQLWKCLKAPTVGYGASGILGQWNPSAMFCLVAWFVPKRKGWSNTSGKRWKTGRYFLVEIKRDKHILAGYNVAYRLRLNFTDTSITQTLGSFDDLLLNNSPAIQQLHVAISYLYSAKCTVKQRNLFLMMWHRSTIWLDTVRSAARNQNWIRVSPDSFSACDKEAGHETILLRQ